MTKSIIPLHAYLVLTGQNLLHPFPIFSYKGCDTETIKNLRKITLNYNEASTIIYLTNNTSNDNQEKEVKDLILVSISILPNLNPLKHTPPPSTQILRLPTPP